MRNYDFLSQKVSLSEQTKKNIKVLIPGKDNFSLLNASEYCPHSSRRNVAKLSFWIMQVMQITEEAVEEEKLMSI